MADAMLLAAAVAAMTFLVLRMLSPPEPLGLVVAGLTLGLGSSPAICSADGLFWGVFFGTPVYQYL